MTFQTKWLGTLSIQINSYIMSTYTSHNDTLIGWIGIVNGYNHMVEKTTQMLQNIIQFIPPQDRIDRLWYIKVNMDIIVWILWHYKIWCMYGIL